jgi:hypothetical protein
MFFSFFLLFRLKTEFLIYKFLFFRLKMSKKVFMHTYINARVQSEMNMTVNRFMSNYQCMAAEDKMYMIEDQLLRLREEVNKCLVRVRRANVHAHCMKSKIYSDDNMHSHKEKKSRKSRYSVNSRN